MEYTQKFLYFLNKILSKKVILICLSVAVIGTILTTITVTHQGASENDAPELYLTNPEATLHTVTLTEIGYSPKELIIRKGDGVLFETTRDVPHWPASSQHPSHLVYPEFDSKGRIPALENWEFLFEKTGSWDYHDHISSNYKGTIHVVESGERKIKPPNYLQEDCTEMEGYKKTQCWNSQLKEVVRTEGADAGFEYLITIYNSEPDVKKSCHEWVHVLGEAGYEVFSEGGEIQLRPETAWCSYGYFHGFMNSLIEDTGSLAQVIDFCNMATSQLAEDLPGIESNCLHGIGHVGVDLFFEEPEYWGNFEKTTDASFNLCEELFSDHQYLDECYGGVIHGLRFSMRNEMHGVSYGTHMEEKDPYYYCRNLNKKYQLACYSDFASMLWNPFNGNIQEALTYVNQNITEEVILRKSIVKTAAAWIKYTIPKNDQSDIITACRKLRDDLFYSCINGILFGYVQHGEPDNLHPKAFEFCSSEYLGSGESQYCFDRMLFFLKTEYSSQKMTQACLELNQPDQYNSCNL